MERKLLGATALTSLIVTIILCFLLLYFPNFHNAALAIRDSMYTAGTEGESVLELLKESSEMIEEATPEEEEDMMHGHQLRLHLPKGVTSAKVKVDNDYVNRTISLTIEGVGRDYFDVFPMTGRSTCINDLTYAWNNSKGVISLVMDDVLELESETEGEYMYFDFVDPHEIYDYVVVIDAGHGGNVPGATKQGIEEKDIDLDIVLELKKLFDMTNKNVGVYYTRTTDCNPAFASRVGLANDTDADLFLSIHNNSTASGRMSSISGTEVLYCAADKTEKSKIFATTCLDYVVEELESTNKGTVVGDDIYIIRESKAPVALVEVGFMTNQKELKNLCDPEYQRKTAHALYNAIIDSLYNGQF